MFRKNLTALVAVLVVATLLFGGCGGGGAGDPIDPPPPPDKEEVRVGFFFEDSKGRVPNLPYYCTEISRSRAEERYSDENGFGWGTLRRNPGDDGSVTVTDTAGHFNTVVIEVPANVGASWDYPTPIRVKDNPVTTRQLPQIEIVFDPDNSPFTLQIVVGEDTVLPPKLNDPDFAPVVEKLVECADLVFIGADPRGYTYAFTDIGQYKLKGWSDELPRPVRVEGIIIIADREAPTLRWPDGTPQNGAVVKDQITLTASVRDNHRLKRAVMKLDGVDVATITRADQSPLTFVWDTTKSENGPHLIVVEAEDETGNTATPLVLNLTVANSTVTPIGTTVKRLLGYSGEEWTCDWGPNGEFGPSPQHGATVTSTDLYVGDTNQRGADGVHYNIGAWQRGHVGPVALFAPQGETGSQFEKFASDSVGNVFTQSIGSDRLYKFDLNGQVLTSVSISLSPYGNLFVDDNVDEEGDQDNEIWVQVSVSESTIQHFSSNLEFLETIDLGTEGWVYRIFINRKHDFLLYTIRGSDIPTNNSTIIRQHDLATGQESAVLTVDHSVGQIFFIEEVNQFILFYDDYIPDNIHYRGVIQYDRDWKQFNEMKIEMELGFQDVLQGADRKSFWLLEGGYYLQARSDDPPARELVFK